MGGVFGALVMPLVAGFVAGGMGLTAALGLAVFLQLAIVPLVAALGETARSPWLGPGAQAKSSSLPGLIPP